MPGEIVDSDVAARAATDDTLRQTDEQRAASRSLSLQPIETPPSVAGYEMLASLGEGSFGTVWLARELRTGKQVAIKFYTHRRGLDWSLLTREVEKLAVLYTSRNIVGLLDVGWDHDPPYFVMEYLEHGSLATRLQKGSLPVETAVRIARAVARALVHAHGSGILHCDLKPANVLLDGGDEPRLADFGQSRMTTEQSPALGTLFYMAPEQADLDAVPDARWDVYALGALLYQMLTGAPPHRTEANEAKIRAAGALEDRLEVYRAVIAQSPRPDGHRKTPGIDKRLIAIVDGCLEPNPERRIANAQVVLDLLERRDKARSRRTLLMLGLAGPLLFVIALFWLGRTAAPAIVEAAEQNLVERALVGDAVSALILADSIHRDLVDRREQLEELAARPETREIARVSETYPGISVAELFALHDGRHADADLAAKYRQMTLEKDSSDARLVREDRTPDQSWFIQDAAGRQVFRAPSRDAAGEGRKSVGLPYHWRAYFWGGQEDLSKRVAVDEVTIRQTSGVSNAFRSEATDQYMVALAVPIWDEAHWEWVESGRKNEDPGRVIGVMARTIHISELLRQWEHTIRDPHSIADPNDRFLALAAFKRTDRGTETTLLDHPWMTRENLQEAIGSDGDDEAKNARLDAFMSKLKLSDRETLHLETLVAGGRDHREGRYIDPFSRHEAEFGGTWLAAFAPVPETTWIAIVQERRENAEAPVQEVQRVFETYGLVAALVFGVLLAIVWYFLYRASMS